MAAAKNIDLSTLPGRDSVQLTIYNPEDLTLVKETREISIKKGMNRLQFSWHNTQIDPTSVQLQFLSHTTALNLVNTTFPHDKPQMLFWHVHSEIKTLVTVEIKYFTSGISWQADYLAVLNQSGQEMTLDSFVTVTNNSGEDYDNAQVRLVVGNINLVEKVSTIVNQAKMKKDEIQRRKQARRNRRAEKMMSMPSGRYATSQAIMDKNELGEMMMDGEFAEEKIIEKDRISEYSIFSIEGKESIPHQWSKRLRSFKAENIPLKTFYRYRPKEYGNILAKVLFFKNDSMHGLGESALPKGKMQIYQQNKQGTLTYLAGVAVKYISPGDKVELNTGADPGVIYQQIKLKTWKDNIWMYYPKARVYRRIDDGLIQVDHKSRVSGWDEHGLYTNRISNFTDQPIHLEVRKTIAGDVDFLSQLKSKKHDFQTLDYSRVLAAGEKQDLLYEVLIRKGRNSKQNNLTLKSKKLLYPEY
jgi:hypothetical protein